MISNLYTDTPSSPITTIKVRIGLMMLTQLFECSGLDLGLSSFKVLKLFVGFLGLFVFTLL